MANAIVTLKKGEGRYLKAGGPWIYDNEVARVMGSVEDGDIVLVHDFDGYPLGRGFINRKSKLRVRMMTRDKDTEVDEAFIRMRVKNAWGRMASTFAACTSAVTRKSARKRDWSVSADLSASPSTRRLRSWRMAFTIWWM